MAMMARTIDKARAALAGTLGDYIYDCPMDRQLFATLGVDGAVFLEAVRGASDDDAVVARLGAHMSMPSGGVIAIHNAAIERWAPKSDKGRAHFLASRDRLPPGFADIATWTDLIDAEEGRAARRAG
jgi:hypothetical protein